MYRCIYTIYVYMYVYMYICIYVYMYTQLTSILIELHVSVLIPAVGNSELSWVLQYCDARAPVSFTLDVAGSFQYLWASVLQERSLSGPWAALVDIHAASKHLKIPLWTPTVLSGPLQWLSGPLECLSGPLQCLVDLYNGLVDPYSGLVDP